MRRLVYVFDTGALIALERRDQRISRIFQLAVVQQNPVLVPMPVVGEWWRGRSDWREKILAALVIEPLRLATVKAAGEALAHVGPAARLGGPSLIDAIVMATAAETGGIVYTSDFDDLTRLTNRFPSVRVMKTNA